MNGTRNFVKGEIWHLTMRELQCAFGSKQFWIGLICVVILLTVSGPFETATDFNTPKRFAYWTGIAIGTYYLALIFMVPVSRYNKKAVRVWGAKAGLT